jgi:predicted NUDIX family NTP pyrophosphohydrolase
MPTRKRHSAGLLMYRRGLELEVLLAHPGGPFFAHKDAGAWTIPKGEVAQGEDARACALREFQEETGIVPGDAELQPLGEIQQSGGKRVEAWAFAGAWAGGRPESNHFELEWPPRSGRMQSFPEIDRLEWFGLSEARLKLNPAQTAFLDRLSAMLDETAV